MSLHAPRDCREEYQATATLYLKRKRLLSYLRWGAVACWLVVGAYDLQRAGLAGFLVVVFLTFFGGMIFLPKLRCPACTHDLETSPVTYCPQCGGPAVRRSKHGASGCSLCLANFNYGKGGRRYKVRHCHACGSRVHEEGL